MGHLLGGADLLNITIGNFEVGEGCPFLIIAGPCVIESWETTFKTAQHLKDLSQRLGFSFVFKSSFDKANRLSINSFRGPGLKEGLEMLQQIKNKLGVA